LCKESFGVWQLLDRTLQLGMRICNGLSGKPCCLSGHCCSIFSSAGCSLSSGCRLLCSDFSLAAFVCIMHATLGIQCRIHGRLSCGRCLLSMFMRLAVCCFTCSKVLSTLLCCLLCQKRSCSFSSLLSFFLCSRILGRFLALRILCFGVRWCSLLPHQRLCLHLNSFGQQQLFHCCNRSLLGTLGMCSCGLSSSLRSFCSGCGRYTPGRRQFAVPCNRRNAHGLLCNFCRRCICIDAPQQAIKTSEPVSQSWASLNMYLWGQRAVLKGKSGTMAGSGHLEQSVLQCALLQIEQSC
jgi:hypothetical protein